MLDVGSKEVNGEGSYRDVCSVNWEYIGVDIEDGPNVDHVMPSEYSIPLFDGFQDVVLCGNVLEHVRNPFHLLAEIYRKLIPGGWVFLAAPQVWRVHRYPIDTFRYNPDGMQAILEENEFMVVDIHTVIVSDNKTDCWAVARTQP